MSDIFEHTEVVAEAICRQDEGIWQALTEEDRDHYRALAMAAIVALEAVVDAKSGTIIPFATPSVKLEFSALCRHGSNALYCPDEPGNVVNSVLRGNDNQ